jgi:hypothetical protein
MRATAARAAASGRTIIPSAHTSPNPRAARSRARAHTLCRPLRTLAKWPVPMISSISYSAVIAASCGSFRSESSALSFATPMLEFQPERAAAEYAN